MLDLSKLIPQFDGISADIIADSIEAAVERACGLLLNAAAHPDEFEKRLRLSRELTYWPLAMPLEPINIIKQIDVCSADHSVVSVDGSQIMPSHHEVYNCYLINVGKVLITYGPQEPVVLESSPHLFHSVEDLYPLINRRRLYVDEAFVALERNLLELSTLRDLALTARERRVPVVAFVDGSLIQWSLDQMPDSYQRNFQQRLTAIYDSFANNSIPLLGYISQSRSSDIINTLRVWHCPYDISHCSQFCGELTEEEFPCSVVWPVTDRQMFANVLPRHTRGPLFESGVSKAASLSDRHHIVFTYVNVGPETARVEIPRWLAEDAKLLDMALGVAIAQTKKGAGYPVCLSEAHNMAVVRSVDRSKFFELVAKHLVQLGVPRVRVSPKESGKRRGIV